MNIKESCKILEIDITQLTYKRVKQQYYKLALLSHPDKKQLDIIEIKANIIPPPVGISIVCALLDIG